MKRYLISLVALMVLGSLNILHAIEPIKWTTTVSYSNDTEGVITWHATIDAGWHLYDMTMPEIENTVTPVPTTFKIEAEPGVQLVGDVTPAQAAEKHVDKVLNLTLGWWENSIEFTQHFKLVGQGGKISGYVRYQGCNDQACIPPTKEPFDLTVGTPVASDTTSEAVAEPTKPEQISEETEGGSKWWNPVEVLIANDNVAANSSTTTWWSIMLWGFLGGLAALLTPCVWPMIPMTMSFFLKKGTAKSKSIADALTYGISIIVIYVVLGLAITIIFGAGKLNDLATSAFFNLIFFAILVIFAISFFGAFDIKLPSKWSNSIDNKAESTTGLLSIFFMAFTLVLVSFSCTGPIIGTLLVEAASQGNISGPALGMGGFALGLALPFSLIAFFPSLLKGMPKSGGWLNSVKVVLGFLELVLSLKFLSVADLAYGWHILDREVFISLWIVLFILLGMYLLGKLRFSHDSELKSVSVPRFFLALFSLSFAMYLIPGLWGAPLKSISAFAPPLSTQDFNLYGGVFREFDDYDEGMKYAEENHMPVLVDFSGFACVNCRKMEGAVFDTPQVREIIEGNFVLIKLMVDDKTELSKPYSVKENGKNITIETIGEKWSYLQRHKFSTNSQPYYVILDNEGNPMGEAQVYNEDVDNFVNWLNNGLETYSAK